MGKKVIGPFHIVGTDSPAISTGKDVTVALHDDQENVITVAFKADLLQVVSQQLAAAARQADSGFSEARGYLPVVVEASKATVVREPTQGLFLLLEVNDGMVYVAPLGRQLATVLRDQLTEALDTPWPDLTVN